MLCRNLGHGTLGLGLFQASSQQGLDPCAAVATLCWRELYRVYRGKTKTSPRNDGTLGKPRYTGADPQLPSNAIARPGAALRDRFGSVTLLLAAEMGIQKQEFYEGAALHQIIRGSRGINSIAHMPPFFVFNGNLRVHLKYSTAKRSPWGFTFLPDEQVLLRVRSQEMPIIIGLICGADGVAAVPYDDYTSVARIRGVALRVSCRRNHREHFEIVGPDGALPSKVAPSAWSRLLGGRGREQ